MLPPFVAQHQSILWLLWRKNNISLYMSLFIYRLSHVIYSSSFDANSTQKLCTKSMRVKFPRNLNESLNLPDLQECVKFMWMHFRDCNNLANIEENGCMWEKTWYTVLWVKISYWFKLNHYSLWYYKAGNLDLPPNIWAAIPTAQWAQLKMGRFLSFGPGRKRAIIGWNSWMLYIL